MILCHTCEILIDPTREGYVVLGESRTCLVCYRASVAAEDNRVRATPRRSRGKADRARIYDLHRGICGACEGRICPTDAWDIEHRVPLAQGGSDDDSNVYPIHRKCHRAKTARDAADTAKCKRVEAKHLGVKREASRPMPGSRTSPYKKGISGRVSAR